ncbi:hypothetical protein IAR50_003183 [Cryptococcus sp. DSM 104548]
MSENSSPTDFAFEPPALPSADNPFVSPGTYKADPLRQTTYDSSLPTGSFTPAAANPPVGGYFPDTSYQQQPGGGQQQQQYGALNSAQSSFSSASGSAAGGSFSSVDLPGPSLPGISKEFSRPSLADTRRPATASVLQTRGQYADYMIGGAEDPRRLSQRHVQQLSPDEREEDEDDDASDSENVSPETVYMPNNNRRASEPHFNLPTGGQGWNQFPPSGSHDASGGAFGLPSAPAHVSPMGYLQQQQQAHIPPSHFSRPSFSNRPQTSDGLPSYTNTITLPPASSIARQVQGGNDSPFFHHPPGMGPARGYEGTFPGNKSFAFDGQIRPPVPPSIPGGIRPSYIPPHPHAMFKTDLAPSDQLGYMSLSSSSAGVLPPTALSSGGGSSGAGQPRKRPRRRYEEIERLYHCGWNGCEKSYGTLNHLNAHVMMQKHGEKRLPAEFKEMRKAWRKKKRDSATATANANYLTQASAWQANQNRLSLSANSSSGESDWDRRDSTCSTFSVGGSDRGSFAAAPGMGMPLMGGGGAWGVPGVPGVPGVMQGMPVPGMMPMSAPFTNGVMVDSRPSTAGSMSSAMSVEPGRYVPTPPGSAPYPHPSHPHPHAHHHAGVQPTFFVNPPPPQSLPSLSNSSTTSTPNPGPAGGSTISNRRPSAPNHLPLPEHDLLDGFRVNEDHPTPTAQNPFPPGSAPGTRPSSSHAHAQGQGQGQGQEQGQGQGQGVGQGGQGGGQGGQGKGFATLNSPVNGGGEYGQFAFQR